MNIINNSNAMTLKDNQEQIKKGAVELGFDQLTGVQRCLMLGEEVGELFKAIRKQEKIKMGAGSKLDPIEDELADILKQLCAVANYYKVDLETAFKNKEDKDVGRWK